MRTESLRGAPAGNPGAREPSRDPKTIGVCIIVENMAVPRDPRVWREAVTLAQEGYRVSVICPKQQGFRRSRETLDGIEIYRHSVWEASGFPGHFAEYAWALAAEFLLALRVFARTRFRVLQACNPPDSIFAIALFFRIFGVRFVFDQHDPAPEFFEARFHGKPILYKMLRLAERLTFQSSHAALVTNESCKEIAITRGGVPPERCFVVRNCPGLNDFPPRAVNEELKRGKRYLVVYVGVMGSQDGVDLLIDSAAYVTRTKGRTDVGFVLIGDGTEARRMRARASERGLDEFVRFTGALYGEDLKAYLAAADVGVAPDPSNPFNDKLTMIKILEYMASGLPVVLFDLPEGRNSAGGAALYARPNDPGDFGEKILSVLDSDALRRRLGESGRRRIVEGMNWESERVKLLEAYRTALGGRGPSGETIDAPPPR